MIPPAKSEQQCPKQANIYSRNKKEIRYGLFPQDDISKKSSTESRSNLNFVGLRLITYGRMYSSLGKRGLLNTQVQITATGPYRYRLEGIVRALLHIRINGNSIKNSEYQFKKL